MSVRTTLHQCKSCRAPILWYHTVNGERMPIDAEPVAGGNVRIIDGTAHVIGCTIDLFDATDDGIRYVPHFATCPDAKEWKR